MFQCAHSSAAVSEGILASNESSLVLALDSSWLDQPALTMIPPPSRAAFNGAVGLMLIWVMIFSLVTNSLTITEVDMDSCDVSTGYDSLFAWLILLATQTESEPSMHRSH